MEIKRILIAAGPSGGHIYPALAVAERLRQISPETEIHLIHSGGPVARRIFSKNFQNDFFIHEISLKGGLASGQKFSAKLGVLIRLPLVFWRCLRLAGVIRPQALLGAGGAVTGPAVLAGICAGKPWGRRFAIWEGNSSLGLANRLLAPFVSAVFTVFPYITKAPKKKQILCGYPLRRKIQEAGKVFEAEESAPKQKPLSQKNGKFHVLVMGGSQGALFFNRVVSQALQEEGWRKDIFIHHQTGERDLSSIQSQYRSLKGAEAFGFSFHIEEYYRKCDLIFSRAGSGAIWEIAAFGKPLVLVPLTHSAGRHQLKNAKYLRSKGMAELIPEQQFTARTFKEMILRLKEDESARAASARSLKAASLGDGADVMARWLAGKPPCG